MSSRPIDPLAGLAQTASAAPGARSDDKLARLAGLLYLVLLPTAGLSFASGQFLTGADAATTVANLQANRTLFELAIVLGAVGFVDYLLVALVLHRLLAPFGQAMANLLLAFVAVSVPISLAAIADRMDVLLLLDGAPGLPPLASEQGRALLMQSLHGSNNLILVSALFWGLWLVPLGWLLLRSALVPRALGVLLLIGSVFYVFVFLGPVLDASYATSALGRIIGIATGIPGTIGELGTALWLLIGPRVPKAVTTPAAA